MLSLSVGNLSLAASSAWQKLLFPIDFQNRLLAGLTSSLMCKQSHLIKKSQIKFQTYKSASQFVVPNCVLQASLSLSCSLQVS